MTAGEQDPDTLLATAERLASGDVSATELVTELLTRADAVDSGLGAYLARFDEQALAAARVADEERAAGRVRGPLHGVPVAVKDLIATLEAPTTGQSRVAPRFTGGWDAPLVTRLRSAGMVILGKTTLNEFAMGPPEADGPFPLPRNPYATDRWPGGSSSGSASGVAAGLFPGAVGTDTGGSIRIPAALCGVSGCKPTFGAVPTEGIIPMSWTADTAGPIARTAADCAAFLEVMAARPAASLAPPADGDLAGVRIGVDRLHVAVEGVAPAVADAFEDAVAVLRKAGADVVDIEVRDRAAIAVAVMTTTAAEAFAVHRPRLASAWQDFGAATRLWLAGGAAHDATRYLQAQRVRAVAQRDLADVLRRCDAVVSPTVGLVAPTFDVDFVSLMPLFFTSLWNATGFPAASVPMGADGAGLPVGLQIGGRPDDEAGVLRVAAAFQHHTDWHTRRPVL